MPLLSQKEVLNLKLSGIPSRQLKIFVRNFGISNTGSVGEIIKRVLDKKIDEKIVDEFIKQKYNEKIQKRRKEISDEDLKKELMKVKTFSWGVIQGQLDQKIQTEYVRRIVRYKDLVQSVKKKLYK